MELTIIITFNEDGAAAEIRLTIGDLRFVFTI